MNNLNIKAPTRLKEETIQKMEQKRRKNHLPKTLLIAACIPTLLILTAFGYRLVSGIDGDNLALDAQYLGNGLVEISVENQANIPLQFNSEFQLEQWSTSEMIWESSQTMPTIAPNEAATLSIQIPEELIAQLETPLPENDWYHFLLTTNNFAFGQTWMASLSFAPALPSDDVEDAGWAPTPQEDNTSKTAVEFISEHYEIQNPLEEMEISFPYNDYQEDGNYIHTAVDLVAEQGSNIYPFAAGTVVEAGFASGGGNYLVIDHGDGLQSTYQHCESLLKEVGDSVLLDDVIATVGQTGTATGPHLGFGLLLDDVPVNPALVLGLE
ncbi:M23 family metallopeptidase [Bengtsoniella intestinalis]|uniref:M23 family metallopeptidase n=1 Tax=Bengtsoniella intestinalis TaxID=3073143 RepID=UPI00391F11F9